MTCDHCSEHQREHATKCCGVVVCDDCAHADFLDHSLRCPECCLGRCGKEACLIETPSQERIR